MLLHFGHEEGNTSHTQRVTLILYKESRSALIGWESRGSRITKASYKTKEGITMNIIECYVPIDDSSDNDKGQLHERLQSIIAKCSGKDLTIRIGDLNAKVGMDNTGYEDIMRRHGLTGRKQREWLEIRKFMRIQQNGYRLHNIPTQTHKQYYMGLTGPHHGEPDRSVKNSEGQWKTPLESDQRITNFNVTGGTGPQEASSEEMDANGNPRKDLREEQEDSNQQQLKRNREIQSTS
ncbi:unnamed protein product [Schistosoma mattheei]|uniref:Uncharacterized protein n=1 Tax=Schistosoma mattheei TaxID=31246 RepID=A0A183PFQ1_9TREM|nr:unnamed protein product [Schistosoma mattheei]